LAIKMLSPSTIAFVTVVVLTLSFFVYKAALPKPLPGIPYNKHSAHRVLGDVPDIAAHIARTTELSGWLRDQFSIHNAPIVQVFARPFGKPWVLIADYREAYDVVSRRTRQVTEMVSDGCLCKLLIIKQRIRP
jgi:hypothetical protein